MTSGTRAAYACRRIRGDAAPPLQGHFPGHCGADGRSLPLRITLVDVPALPDDRPAADATTRNGVHPAAAAGATPGVLSGAPEDASRSGGTVRIPPAKVVLSTSSVYPETTSSAFELAGRL